MAKDFDPNKKAPSKEAQAEARASRGLSMDDTAFRAPKITRQPAGLSFRPGGKVRLSVGASGLPQPKYRWFHNGAPVDGANGPVLVIPNARHSAAGTYSVEAFNMAGADMSRAVAVSLLPSEEEDLSSVDARIIPGKISVAPGVPFRFQIALTPEPKQEAQYQWFKDGNKIKGANGPTIHIGQAKEKYIGKYQAVVKIGSAVIETDIAELEFVSPAQSIATPPPVSARIIPLKQSNRPRLERKRALLERLFKALTNPGSSVDFFDESADSQKKAA
jgi:hypothetical protein